MVQSLGGRGEGLLRGGDGKVVFVPGTLPGERVLFVRIRSGGSVDRGSLERVVEPSPARRSTPCELDRPGGCGGCQLLHGEPVAVAEFKAAALREDLVRAGCIRGGEMEGPLVPGSGLGYRNHVRFAVDPRGRLAYVARSGGGRRGGRRPIPVERCPVLHPGLNALIPVLDGRLRDATGVELRIGEATGERLAAIDSPRMPAIDPVRFPAALLWRRPGGGGVPLRGLPFVHEEIAGVRFRIGADSFFQGNSGGAEVLVRLVRQMLPAGPVRNAVDLHAGVGLFALAALGSASTVTAVETDPSAVDDLHFNGAGRNLRVRPLDAADHVADMLAVKERPDVVVVDPPRTGLGDRLLGGLRSLRAPVLIYVSCAPRHLARELPALLTAGYRIDRIAPVDQFAGTAHLEAVVRLSLPD